MILINNPDKSVWVELLKRPMMNTESLHETVRSILNQIKNEGDEAVLRYEETFDHVRLESLVVTEEETQEAESLVSDELKKAILLAKSNIARFHKAQRFGGVQVETQPGVACWQQSVPIERVGLYIPGGTAPLFSTVLSRDSIVHPSCTQRQGTSCSTVCGENCWGKSYLQDRRCTSYWCYGLWYSNCSTSV